MKALQYGDLVFEPGLVCAQRADEARVLFTRQERLLLLRFTQSPGVLFSRAQLLETIGGSASERGIDLIINRLRARLGDSAKEPRYIATRYGEGYVWLAEPQRVGPEQAFLLIGPVYGHKPDDSCVAGVLGRLSARLASLVGPTCGVVCRPEWRPEPGSLDRLDYTLEICLHRQSGQMHAAYVLYAGAQREIVSTMRWSESDPVDEAALDGLAKALCSAIWSHAALPAGGMGVPTERPPHLRLHDAAMMLTGNNVSWRENERRLQDLRQARGGEDPPLALLRALNQYARLVQSLEGLFRGELLRADAWDGIEDEMEATALACLPRLRDDPMLAMGVAKVLHFINRGHLALVEALVEEAFARSTAFAAVFSMKGQIAASRGDLGQALAYYDQAIELAQPGSQFHQYLSIIKATALMAQGDHRNLELLCAGLLARTPELGLVVDILRLAPGRPPGAALSAGLSLLSEDASRHLLLYVYRISARQLKRRTHRRHVVRGLVSVLVPQFGASVMPAEVAELFPPAGWR